MLRGDAMKRSIWFAAACLAGGCFTAPRRSDGVVGSDAGVTVALVGVQCGVTVDDDGRFGWLELLTDVRNGSSAPVVVRRGQWTLLAAGRPPLRPFGAPSTVTLARAERWTTPIRFEDPLLACNDDLALATDGALVLNGTPLPLPPLRFVP